MKKNKTFSLISVFSPSFSERLQLPFHASTLLNTKSEGRREGEREGEGVCDHDVMIQMIGSLTRSSPVAPFYNEVFLPHAAVKNLQFM